jgi:polyadenylate-binding protein
MTTQQSTVPQPTSAQPTPQAPQTSGSVQSSFVSASLYVGELAPDVTEANLFEIFNQIGPVASIRVCRDAITRRSLGYAYVNFHTLQDAERALDAMNNASVKGKPCRIMWSQRDPSLRKSGKGNIFIKNLDKTIDTKALYETFQQFGQILSCKIELDENNQSKGYGYIQFVNGDAADKASAKVNGMMLAGKKVFVGPFVSRKERIAQNSSKKYTNIYINNLDESIVDDKLKELFAPYGEIKSCVVMKGDDGKSKGFGFINFDTPEQAEKAVNEMNGKEIGGKAIYAGRAQKKSERESELRSKFEQMKMEHMQKYQGVNLYIKNLEDDYDDDKLRAIFTPYGTVTSCKVMRDNKNNSKGFGFVCFSNPEEATRAVTEMNGKIIGSKPLYVALAQRKEVRRAQLEQQFAQRAKGLPPRMPPGPMYNGQPVFFPQPGQPFVYPGMMPRGRFPPGPYGQPMPNYVMVGGGRGGQQIKNAGRGRGGMGMQQGRRGMKNQNAMPTPIPVPIAPIVPQPQQEPINSVEEQKRMLGEKLYTLIYRGQPQLAGKITGMILESSHADEIIQLIEAPEQLDSKVGEALNVLKDHDKAK